MEDQIKQKPKELEIPESSPRVQGSGPSPTGMHGFPLSPQSPELVPVSRSSKLSKFSDFNPDETSPEFDKVGGGSLRISVGEYVLVRCNQSKWLLGQVRRSSKTGVRVWVGAAQTLVEVPFGLLVSHLVKLDSPCSSSSTLSPGQSSIKMVDSLEVGACGQVLAPFHCVRPAHLSHRKLYQPLGLLPSEDSSKVLKQQQSSSTPTHRLTNEHSKELHLSSGLSSLPALTTSFELAAEVKNKWNSQQVYDESSKLCEFKFSGQEESSSGQSSSKLTRLLERTSSSLSSSTMVNDAWLTVIENGLKKKNTNL